MEDGGSFEGSDARHEVPSVRYSARTSHATQNEAPSPTEPMRFPWSSPSPPSSPESPRATTHKRSLSGGILAKFNFLRPVWEDGRDSSQKEEPSSPRSTRSGKSVSDDDSAAPVEPSVGETGLASALNAHNSRSRKRKGSLRKTALLGGKRLVSEGKERKNSTAQRNSIKQTTPQQEYRLENGDDSYSSVDAGSFAPALITEHALLKKFSYEDQLGVSNSSSSGWPDPPSETAVDGLSLITDESGIRPQSAISSNARITGREQQDPATLSSPSDPKSPNSLIYASTTEDDDDGLSFSRPSISATSLTSSAMAYVSAPDPASASYFPPPSPRPRSRTAPQPRALPLQQVYVPAPEPYPYTETEYWGWVILFVTWLVFTVGMGSCLEVWSWAWDVGETPYAPPELEDDPTLPIVGYYPALIVLTGVVAWVWITVAWVGMKYFRHAKIEV